MIQGQKLIFNFHEKILMFCKSQWRTMCMKKPTRDLIGPPDRISNLCHIKYAVHENETPTEREFRKCREELQAWNEDFWRKHNVTFINKKKEFLSNELNEKDSSKMLNSDDISIFYKDFLDKNWKTHLTYLFEWYRKNTFVTYLHLRVNIEKMFKKKM